MASGRYQAQEARVLLCCGLVESNKKDGSFTLEKGRKVAHPVGSDMA
ncbi:hypothetical protein [uncultured Cohaesibacter sp.]|nr:hypothetical protein [uncultured Cohaesibacter sp.]